MYNHEFKLILRKVDSSMESSGITVEILKYFPRKKQNVWQQRQISSNAEEHQKSRNLSKVLRTLRNPMPTTNTVIFLVGWFHTSRTLLNDMLKIDSSLGMRPNTSLNYRKTILFPPYENFGLLVIWCPDDQENFHFWFDACSTIKCFCLRHFCGNKPEAMGNIKLKIVVNQYWKNTFRVYSDCEEFNGRTRLTIAYSFEGEFRGQQFAYRKVWVPTSGKVNDNYRFDCFWLSIMWRNVEKVYSPDRIFF